MSDDRRKLQQEADQAARKGDLATAASCYRKLLAYSPNDLTLLQRLGDALARSGQEAAARDVLVRLAEEYWRSGFRSRSTAVLKRAVRLGEAQPDLLVLLGERTLEQGLLIDAREPLLEAATLREKADDEAGAELLYRQIAESLPRDLTSRQALLRLAEARGDGEASNRLRLELALALAVSGDLEGGFRALIGVVRADGGGNYLSRIPELLLAFQKVGIERLKSDPPGLSAASAGGWAVLVAAFQSMAGDATGALSRLHRIVAIPDRYPPRVLLWAGRALLDQNDLATARAAIVPAVDQLCRDGQTGDEVVDVLTALVVRDNDAVEARALLDRLTRPVVTGPQPTGPAEPSVSTAPPHRQADPAEELPDAWRPLLLEIRSLVEHGLWGQARQALGGIPPNYRGLPDIVAMERRIADNEGRPPSRVNVPPATPRKTTPLKSGLANLEVVLEDEEGGTAEPIGSMTGPTTVEGTTGPVTGAVGGRLPEGPDPGQIAKEIQSQVGDEDFETQYQMGIGLLEMGLEEQGLELLESACRSPGREAEIALVLLQRRVARGEAARGLPYAEEALEALSTQTALVHAELLATMIVAAQQCGQPEHATRYAEVLEAQFPQHPALATWRMRIPSES